MNEIDKLVEKMIEFGRMSAYYKRNFYGHSHFKVNSSSTAMLSRRQFEILLVLKYIDTKSLSLLAKVLHSSCSNLSILISKLIEQGYVLREFPCNKDDKRKIYFYITEKGEEIVEQTINKIVLDVSYFYERLNEYQQLLLIEGMNYLVSLNLQGKEAEYAEYIDKDSSNGSIFIARKIFDVLILFFNWSHSKFKSVFKLNGNDEKLISDSQFEILFCINKFNCNTISKLEKIMCMESSTLSNSISKLVKGGFVNRVYPNENSDGRIVYFLITEKGDIVLKQIENSIRSILNDFLNTLDDEQHKKLVLGLDKIYELLVSIKENESSVSDNVI